MTSQPNEALSARDLAAQLLDARLDVVSRLASHGQDVERARAALDEAERTYAATWKEAADAGWTDAELRKIGLTQPGRRTPGRPRKRAASSPSPSAPASGEPEQTPAV